MTQLIKNEIDIMLKLTSPYIVKLIDIKRTAKNICGFNDANALDDTFG